MAIPGGFFDARLTMRLTLDATLRMDFISVNALYLCCCRQIDIYNALLLLKQNCLVKQRVYPEFYSGIPEFCILQ